MWVGGVRVVLQNEEGKILMVKQHHENRDIWMVPGGGIEEGENSIEAAVGKARKRRASTLKFTVSHGILKRFLQSGDSGLSII